MVLYTTNGILGVSGDDAFNSKPCLTLELSTDKSFVAEIYTYQPTAIIVRVFPNGPGHQGSILGCHTKDSKKLYLMPLCLTLSIIRVWFKDKWSNSGNGVAPWCSSYWKGSFWVALNYGHPTYLYMCVCVCV